MRQRDIFIFWLPLFASWLLMSAEGPIISAAINRLPDEAAEALLGKLAAVLPHVDVVLINEQVRQGVQ